MPTSNSDYIKYHCQYFGDGEYHLAGIATHNYLMGVDHFFSICENKTVLEIGPFVGLHTALIDDYKPQHITLVEANPECNEILSKQFPNATVVTQDIFHFLEKPYKVDVAVCCGVLYHLHSPVYLLELIANKVDPDYIIIESVVSKDQESKDILFLRNEVDNVPGNRYTSSSWKSAGISMEFSQHLIDTAMNNLGYSIVEKDDDLGRFGAESKKFAVITLYKKND